MPDWAKFYGSLELGDGGVLAGPTHEARAFQAWFLKQRRMRQYASPGGGGGGGGGVNGVLTLPGRPQPPPQRQCRACATAGECLRGREGEGEGWRCVAESSVEVDGDAGGDGGGGEKFRGCCKFDTRATEAGRRLLRSSSSSGGNSSSS